MHILIIEDDTRLSQNIQKLLERSNFTLTVAGTGEKGMFYAETESYDAIILDRMLPDADGIILCKKLRKKGNSTPIIMLTAKSQIEDKVEGLMVGADDYLTKPFRAEELVARLHSLIRRGTGKTLSSVIQISDLKIDTAKHGATRGNVIISLAPKEYSLLEYLAFHAGEAVGRLELLHHVWGEDIDPLSNTVDVHIRYLRQKIDDDFPKKLIKTIKGKGYMICED
jgi:two-component system OmpR family response regulator